jgi:tryptophan halogenase
MKGHSERVRLALSSLFGQGVGRCYATPQRDDTRFWKACTAVELPESLKSRIALFRARGVLRDGVDDMFRAPSWPSVMEGMGIRPQRYQQMVDRIPYSAIEPLMDRSAPMLADFVATLPTHQASLDAQCPAEPFRRSA